MRLNTIIVGLVLCLVASVDLYAQSFEVQTKSRWFENTPKRNYANLRVGASSANTNQRPTLCREVEPVLAWSIEACGTGQGFLHDEPGKELAHFRAKWRGGDWQWREAYFGVGPAIGFVELQVGDDEPGFDFRNTNDQRTAAAGCRPSPASAWRR